MICAVEKLHFLNQLQTIRQGHTIVFQFGLFHVRDYLYFFELGRGSVGKQWRVPVHQSELGSVSGSNLAHVVPMEQSFELNQQLRIFCLNVNFHRCTFVFVYEIWDLKPRFRRL